MATPVMNEESAKKVFRQVEFYFCNSNLPKDAFLRKTIEESEDGMVDLALICSFSRMKGHLGLGSVKADEIPDEVVKFVADTLRSSELLKISDDGKKVGRKTELPKVEELIEQLDSQTIAVSPLPYDVKIEDVESIFAEHAKVNSVRLPGHVSNKKHFCGTALVEFSSEEDAEKVLKLSLTYAGIDLELKTKKEFDAEREEQIAERGDVQAGSPHKNGGEAKPSYPKGVILAFEVKRISSKGASTESADSQKPEKASEDDKNGAPEISTEDGKENNGGNEDEKSSVKKDDKKEPVEEKFNIETYKDNKDVVYREDLKSVLEEFGSVKFIDFKAGAESGYIRFEEEEAPLKARAAAVLTEEGGLLVKNFIITLEPVTGDAEKEYWSKIGPPNNYRSRDERGNRGRGGKQNRRWKQGRDGGRPNKARRF